MLFRSSLLASVKAQPDRPAVICPEDELTYAELNRRVNRVCALLLAHGVQAGDRVAYLLPTGPELIEVYYAIQYVGATAVPLNLRSIPREVSYLVRSSGAGVLVYADCCADIVRAADLDGVTLVTCGPSDVPTPYMPMTTGYSGSCAARRFISVRRCSTVWETLKSCAAVS